MSFDLTRRAWDVPNLDAPARLVLLCLSDAANEEGVCWPSIQKISDRTGLGDRAIRYRIEALTAGGLLSLKRRHRKDGSLGSYEYTVHLPAPHAASPPACGAAHESTSPEATISSSLRSEEELDVGAREQLTVAEAKPEIAKEFSDWHMEARGHRPVTGFLALRSVSNLLLKRGYDRDEIIDAMKTSRVMTAKSLSDEIARKRHAADGTVNTAAVPAALVRAWVRAKPWIKGKAFGASDETLDYWLRCCAAQMRFGYGVGETMIRFAVALRANNVTTFGLTDVQGVDRFEGELADYPDAMERAWRNRYWRAS